MKGIQDISDGELFRIFVSEGKPEPVFNEIINRYKMQVYRQIRRIVLIHDDADEVAQIVFIKLWSSAASFRFESALSSYIYRIAYNESISFLKKKNRFSSLDGLLDKDGHYRNAIDNGTIMDGNDIEKALQKALLSLPEKQRLVFQYRYFEDMPYKDISAITGTSEGALKASYHIAAEKLKKIIDDN